MACEVLGGCTFSWALNLIIGQPKLSFKTGFFQAMVVETLVVVIEFKAPKGLEVNLLTFPKQEKVKL